LWFIKQSDCKYFINLFYSIQVEGPKSPEEMLVALQRVLEESSPVLVAARLDAEERRNNARLREEQDAAYRAALEADQVCFL
jgi:FAS-associated factor 2